ncbi:MFS transporter [Pedobacter hartonius]|nr:MFS transporter [Pedobacter hartonius]
METHKIPLFKPWVSEWMARSVIFSILMTCLYSFAFYSNPATVIRFYGIQPGDVEYGAVVIYGSTVAFLALDFRIVKYFAPRRYLLTAIAINSICSLVCLYSGDWSVFIVCQFVQGITCALMSGIVLNLVFPRLHSTRARVIGYTILYAGIQISAPFYSIYSSMVLHYFDFNWLFYGSTILLLALTVIVLLTMNDSARFHKKIPLYQVDWIGYLLYVVFILTMGYILVYGRQLGWFSNNRILFLLLFVVLILSLFVIRQLTLKRPLINLVIFKEKNFIIGLVLLFTFYIFKGSTGLAYGYLEVILQTDPLQTVPIWITVICGTVISMFATSRFVLMGYNLMRIILLGFGIMALYYLSMLHFVSVKGETADLILPLFIYSVATGVLFVPIVAFTISAAPPKIAFNASLIGIFARFTGFTASLAFNNELQAFIRYAVRKKVNESVDEINVKLSGTLKGINQIYLHGGKDIYITKDTSGGYLNKLIKAQIFARATHDYYDWMFISVVCVMGGILIFPQIKNVILKLKRGSIPY